MQIKGHLLTDSFHQDHQTVMLLGRKYTRETTVLGRVNHASLQDWNEKIMEVNKQKAIWKEKCGDEYKFLF